MKKILIIALMLIGITVGCKNEGQNSGDINNQIMTYKEQVAELNSKIKELESQVEIDSTGAGKLLVDTVVIKKRPFKHYITVTANVEAEKYALISPQMNGQVIKIYVQEGQRVSQGQLLAKLNDDVLQKNLAQLQTSLLLADTMYQKQKTLYDQKVVSEVQYLQAKNQKEALEKNIEVIKSQIAQAQIRAPFSGIIDKIDIKEGELASPGRAIFELVNLGSMISNADVSEKYLPSLNIGDNVTITFPTYPDIKIETKIYQKGNVIDATNRTFWIKFKYPNIKEQIKPNMLSIVQLSDYESKSDIVIPSNILNQDINGWYVFSLTLKDNSYVANKTYVEIGISDNENTIITKGLKEGDIVVSLGFNQITEGMEVKISSNN